MSHQPDQLRYHETIVETMAEVTWVLDTDRKLKFVNGRVSEILNVQPDELIGQHFLELLQSTNHAPDEKLDEYETIIEDLLHGDQDLARFELPLELPSGEVVIEIRSRPITENGQVTGVVCVARDITERIQSEEELQRRNKRLKEFASIVSHDLRNPLTVAKGRLRLAAKECDSDHLDSVAQAHSRMETLIDDMLSLAKVGDRVGETEPIELSGLFETCWRNVETSSATKVIDTEASIQGDKSRLQQLIENLIRNAIDHGGSEVTVRIGDLADGFYIEDDGPGIPAADREKVLETGYSTSDDGSGFGLSIVYDIALAHGWDLTITEGSDGGARIEITDVDFVTE